MTSLRRAPLPDSEWLLLDEVQRAAVAHRGGVLRVLGAPGTGKTTVAVETVADRVLRGELTPDQCLILTNTRRAAGRLRERVTARVGRTSTEPLARSHQAFAFGILRRLAVLEGESAPRLLTGPEQDAVLRDLLAGHARGEVVSPDWPERVRLALSTVAFRGELRDLLMRAVELGLEPEELAELGRAQERQDWVAAAQVLREYDEVTALSSPGAYDPAWILGAAADRLEEAPPALVDLRAELRLVVVDDAQELTPAAVRLLHTLAGPGSGLDVVLLGDPDAATQTFRGADPRILAHEWSVLAEPATTLVLPRTYRSPQRLREVATAVAGHIGVLGEGVQRQCLPSGPGGEVAVALLRSAAQEAQFIAGRLRAAHLRDGVPWADMAVVVRGRARTTMLRRVLSATGVPVAADDGDLPVRDEVAVRPFLILFGWALELVESGFVEGAERAESGPVMSGEIVVDLLTSPLGGADAVAVRRLRRGLFGAEMAEGGSRTSDALLVEAVHRPALVGDLGPEAGAVRRVARVLAAAVDALREPGATAEDVLWRMWSAAGLADQWRRAALGTGAAAARADRDLDAILGLFAAAAAHTDRLPGAAPGTFLDHLAAQEVAPDSLVARAQRPESVALLTPAAAAGQSWRFVVVAGVQEGVWPDLRLRGSLLGSQQLVDVVTQRGGDRRSALAAVRHDETRLFLVAVTRASQRLLVTAVRSDDEQPSPFLDLVDPRADLSEAREFADPTQLFTLTSLVAELRREVVSADPERRGAALTALARLARADVAGADPSRWWQLVGLTDDRPRREVGVPVQVSPSRLQSFQECSLRSVLQGSGGEGPKVGSAEVGSLIHAIAHECADDEISRMRSELDLRWPSLDLRPGWVTDRKRREAQDMLTRFAAYVADVGASGWRRLATERDLALALGRTVVRGRVDRIEGHEDGSVRIVDLKTGGSKPSKSEVPRHAQLGAYQLAVREGGLGEDVGTKSAGAQLVHVGLAGGSNPQNLRSTTMVQAQTALDADDDPRWADELVATVGEGLAGSVFRATPGKWCDLCPVQSSCPARLEGRTV